MAEREPGQESGHTPESALDRALVDAREQAIATEEILVALARAGANPGEILDIVIERAVRLCRAHAGQLHLADGEVFRLSRTSRLVPEGFRQQSLAHPTTRDRGTLLGRVVADGRTLQIPDVLADTEYGRQDLQQLAGYRTLMSAPMILDDEVVGTLAVWRLEVDPFDQQEVDLVSAFAAQAAIVLRQVELMTSLETRGTELAHKVEQLEALRDLGEAVSSSLDPDEVLSRIVTHAVHISGTDGGSIMEYDEEHDAFIVRTTFGSGPDLVQRLRATVIHRHDTLVGRAATEGRPLQVEDLEQAPMDSHLAVLRDDGWRSVLAIPILRGSVIVGVLVIRRRSVGVFSADVVELLETFADQSSVAIVNARLFREVETKSAELEIASRHKSEFLASMSHELRTPLNAVIGFSEVLLDRMFGELNDRQDEYVRDIYNSGRHLLELLNEILDLSKVEAGQMVLEPSTFRVADALEYAASLVRERAASHGITLTVDAAPDVDTVHADELRFKQVVLNLASNAVKFTPDGGAVDIRAERTADEVVVTVTDTGVGIPLEDRERIFDSFQQGGRGVAREEGTGLGLTLSRRIVELFDGRLWLESQVGVGSTFGFSLPLASTPSAVVDGSAHPMLLLVDDDRASLDLVTAYLEGVPVRLERAYDGEAALASIAAATPSAVVLDIRLPKLDGWTVLQRLRADPATSQIPVVVVSVVDERARGLEEGANDYLIKPISRDDLVGALARAGVPMAQTHAEGAT